MDYRVFVLKCDPEYQEIFIAELAQLGFDMMQEMEDGIEAFSEDPDFDESLTDAILEKYSDWNVTGEWKSVENTNWNEEWEKNYEPVVVEDKCIIKASFHKIDIKYPLEITINPQMSFGTGHHATTYLMVQASFDLNMNGTRVLDAGCGTGVLAIVAEKLGAKDITAYDVSQLCTDNTWENIASNSCSKIKVSTGVLSEIPTASEYDVIYANINKNVLLEEMKDYAALLSPKGALLLSGFFDSDIEDLMKVALKNGLKQDKSYVKDGWAALKLVHDLPS